MTHHIDNIKNKFGLNVIVAINKYNQDTEKEIEYCESRKKQKYQHYAGRFAAKEAAFKAISKILDDKYSVCWKDFETINDGQGRPSIILHNINTEKIESIDVSISHCKEYAIANVVILFK